jgi:hypothetical protein
MLLRLCKDFTCFSTSDRDYMILRLCKDYTGFCTFTKDYMILCLCKDYTCFCILCQRLHMLLYLCQGLHFLLHSLSRKTFASIPLPTITLTSAFSVKEYNSLCTTVKDCTLASAQLVALASSPLRKFTLPSVPLQGLHLFLHHSLFHSTDPFASFSPCLHGKALLCTVASRS